jgi:hypothetical protein
VHKHHLTRDPSVDGSADTVLTVVAGFLIRSFEYLIVSVGKVWAYINESPSNQHQHRFLAVISLIGCNIGTIEILPICS